MEIDTCIIVSFGNKSTYCMFMKAELYVFFPWCFDSSHHGDVTTYSDNSLSHLLTCSVRKLLTKLLLQTKVFDLHFETDIWCKYM